MDIDDSKPFSGLLICVAGQLTRERSTFEVKELIRQYGGNVDDSVTQKTTHVITSPEMVSMLENPYKLQFYPDLEIQLNNATKFKIPVVDETYLDKCIKADRKVDEQPYFIKKQNENVPNKRQKVNDDPMEIAEEQLQYMNFDSPLYNQPSSTAASKLDERVQDLISTLFDEAQMERALTGMKLNAKKCMGSVTQNDVLNGYKVLQELESEIQLVQAKRSTGMNKLNENSAKFFRLIPHAAQSPPTINSMDQIKEKMSMLEGLSDIVIAAELIRGDGPQGSKESPIDLNYSKLQCEIKPLEKYSQEFDLINQYVKNTHAAEHDSFSLDIKEVFEVGRKGESDKFLPYKKLPHHRLLWHGSRLTNYIGILTNGLRIAPPEAPTSGYFLGKGIYLADMVSKSAEYCHAKDFKNQGILLLCDAALGRPFQLAHGKFISKEDLDEAGFHSTKGCGEKAPDPSCDLQTSEGVIVPLGREVDAGVICSELPHNEYIVYDTAQVNIKYLITFDFTFVSKKIR